MTSKSRNQDISPTRSDPERIVRRCKTFAIVSSPMTNREMPTRIVAIRVTNIWNVDPTILRPGPSSYKEADAVDMLVSYEHHDFLMETKDVKPVHVEMQRMVESALHVLQETTLACHIEAMIETEIASLLDTANHEAAKG